jgi:hypothetical protein
MKKILIIIMTITFTNACSVIKNYSLNSFTSSKYKSIPFSEENIPAPPDYSLDNSWAVLPSKYPKPLIEIIGNTKPDSAAVFFIYPTLLLDPEDISWNSDIYKKQIRDDVINKAVKYQASAWASAGELYVPFYRQAHIRIFTSPYNESRAWELAYSDLKKSFEYFLKYHRKNRPIIIASHSQGAIHAKRLLQEYFDGTDLQNELVAAYLIGTQIKINDFKNLKPLESKEETGGYVSWNTYKKNRYPKKYNQWFKGGVVTNPINWNSDQSSDISEHLGILYIDDKIYPKSVKVYKTDGLLWTSVPKVPNRILLNFIKSYHYADINLFWADIKKNSKDRLNAWFKNNNN